MKKDCHKKKRCMAEIKTLRESIAARKSLLSTLKARAELATGDAELKELRESAVRGTELEIKELEHQLEKALKDFRAEEMSEAEFEEAGHKIAQWQKKQGRKGLPYKEWRKKYGDKFTKV